MIDWMTEWDETPYPELLRKLPEVDLPPQLKGIRAWLLQSDKTQAVFFDIGPGTEVPLHCHCAQWGMVIEGEMNLTIGDKTHTYKKGDWYYIPEGVDHGAKFDSRVYVLDVFDDPERYKAKQ
ncbi:cupin domain-containing protein [Acidobacteriota bacterium]